MIFFKSPVWVYPNRAFLRRTSFLILFFNSYYINLNAQYYLSIEGQLGHSRPLGIWENQKKQLYDFNGILSNYALAKINYSKKRNTFSLNFGSFILGYQTFSTQGFTDMTNFPQAGLGLPIDYKQTFRFRYISVGPEYHVKLRSSTYFGYSIHYLYLYKLTYEQYYEFPNPNINTFSNFNTSYQYQYTYPDNVIKEYNNQIITLLNFKYNLSRFISLKTSYLIGINNIYPALGNGQYMRIHQNFGIGLECQVTRLSKDRTLK